MTSGKAYTVKLRYKLYSPTYRNNGAKVDICCYTRDHNEENAKHVDYHRGWCNTCDWTEAIVARHVYKPANPAINHPEEYYLYVNINLSRDVSEDRSCYIRIDDVQILEEDAETVTIERWSGSGADYTAWTSPAHYDTKDTDTTPGGALSSLSLQAAGHERTLFQAVIRPTATWSDRDG